MSFIKASHNRSSIFPIIILHLLKVNKMNKIDGSEAYLIIAEYLMKQNENLKILFKMYVNDLEKIIEKKTKKIQLLSE